MSTDWGNKGKEGFLRDPGNEQVAPLPANGVFTGTWTRVDAAESFLLLYGTHVPFTLQIQWSRDGVSRDLDPFATITPQVRSRLGLYSVISPQSTFFRPYYRMVVTNGPSPQFFVVSDALLLSTVFQGYDIDVDGPIPVLGLAKLGIGLNWTKHPVLGWQPTTQTAAGALRAAVTENLAGLATDAKLDQVLAALGTPPSPVALDSATLAALEQIVVTLAGAVSLDPVSLAALEQIVVTGVVTMDPATLAALENITATISGPVNVGNWPADYPDTAVLAKLEAIRLLLATPPASVVAAGTPAHLTALGTTVVKATPGVLERVVVNKISAATVVLLTLYNGLTVAAPVLASIQIGATAPGSSGIAGPVVLDYFASFSTGLTANLSAVGADVTVVWR